MGVYNRERLKKELNTRIPKTKSKELIIWGTGNTAQLYQEGLIRLHSEGFQITAYCDNNMDKCGKEFCGKPVVNPKELWKYKNACVLICTPNPQYIHEISAQLEKLNIPYYLLDEVILKQHTAEVLKCYDLLEDDKSKKIYVDIILSRIEGRFPSLDICTYSEQYFSHYCFQTASTTEEVFVDCGSYVGDTLEKYIWSRNGIFGKIIAFEPDSGNYAAMQKRVMRLKKEWHLKDDSISLMPYGLADKTGDGMFSLYEANNGLGSKFVGKVTDDDNGGESGLFPWMNI